MRHVLIGVHRVLEVVSRVALFVAAVGLVAMTALIAWQIWGRYINNSTPSWTEASSIIVMSWFIFLGTAVGVRENFHLGFDVLVYVLPKGAAPVLATISDVAVLAFGLGMGWYGAVLSVRTWSDHIAGLGIPRGVGYLPLTVGGILVSLFVLERVAARFAGISVDHAASAGDVVHNEV